MIGSKAGEAGKASEENEYSLPPSVDMLGMLMGAFLRFLTSIITDVIIGVMFLRVPLQIDALLPDESHASELQEPQTPLIQSKAASDPVRSRLG